MAQNSIARLAVQIVTDTSGMTSGFRRAEAETTSFGRSVDGGNAKLSLFGRLSADAAKDVAGLGSAGKLAFKFGGIAGPVGLAATSVAALSIGLARLADSSEDFRIEKLREVGELTPGLKTTTELFGVLREQLSTFAELAGFSLKPLLGDLKDLARSINVLTFGHEAVANLEKQNAAAKGLAEQFKKRKDAEEESAKASAKAAENTKRQHDELVRRGESIAKSLRTPSEIFDETLKELRQLAAAGAITGEILQRGIGKAADEFRKTVDTAKELKRELTGVPALEVGTQAFRSAVLNFQSAARGGESSVAKASLEVERRIAAAVEAMAKRPPITLKTASL